MNSTIQNTTIDSLLHSLIISKKGFKVGWPFTFATAKGEAQIDRFHSGIWVLCHLSVGVSKEIKRRAEGVQVQLYHQTIKQMADYISFSRQACLVALAGHWQIQDIYLRNISDADLSWNISFTVLVFRAVIAPFWYRICSSTSNITLVIYILSTLVTCDFMSPVNVRCPIQGKSMAESKYFPLQWQRLHFPRWTK